MTFNQAALKVATHLYRATPSRRLRQFYFDTFLRVVRGRKVIRTVEQMTFELDLGELIDVTLLLQQYERDIVTLIERLTMPGMTVFDIGANIGAHTLRFSKHVGPGGRVHAFEPMEYAFTKLTRNLTLNQFAQTSAWHLALSDRNEPAREVHYRSSWTTDGARRTESSTVPLVRLDDWCAAHGVDRVDLIKIDVDGLEMPVLRGAEQTLRRSRPPVLMEAGAWHFATPDENPFVLLSSLGYDFWDTLGPTRLGLDDVRRRLPERDETMSYSINLLASAADPTAGAPR